MGVDLVEVERVRSALARWGDRFLERVFTPEEVTDARRGGDFAASLAARFAAKEAAYKALREELGEPLPLRSIVVSAGRGHTPHIAVVESPASRLAAGLDASGPAKLIGWCSLSHTGGLACAVVVVEDSRS